MAKVRITFEDNKDGSICINMESDNPMLLENENLPINLENITNAQHAAVLVMEYIVNMVEGMERGENVSLHEPTTLH